MFDLQPLPYRASALEPWLSKDAVSFHYQNLHARYVERLNRVTRGTSLAEIPLPDLVASLDPDDQEQSEIYRMAAQVWNHDFYWRSMKPKGGGRPGGALGEEVSRSMGSYKDFREAFVDASKEVFGAGWVWVMTGPDGSVNAWAGSTADNPMRYGYRPLLVCDLWEHAYYIDYPADKSTYVATFLDHLVNWEFAEANYKRFFG